MTTAAALESMKVKIETLTAEFAALVTRTMRTILIPSMEINLREGEFYAGIVLNENGTPREHLIGMPGTFTGNWGDSMAWAKSIGGELPTRQEQALLFANCKVKFEQVWHWSSEQHAGNSGYAWGQYFGGGDQYDSVESASGRARAVRRLKI